MDETGGHPHTASFLKNISHTIRAPFLKKEPVFLLESRRCLLLYLPSLDS
ncbi:hypothetical protein BBOR36S_04304 [Brevibacillus borstelensis]